MTPEQQLTIEGITADLVMDLHNKYGLSILTSLRKVYSSDTFKMLSDPESGFLHYSHLYLLDSLEKEYFTGKLQ